jgi:large subunit ribosomal protein L5
MKKELKKEKKTNIWAKPRITSVVINAGVGKLRDDKNIMKIVKDNLKAISGQQAQEKKARKAVAAFKVRAGNLVGLKVTLRGKRRDDFVQRFTQVTLPRVRDFRGISLKSLDGQGNLSVGLTEQVAFPEIEADKVDSVFGLQITFVTSAKNNAEGEKILREAGFPLQKRKLTK